MTHTTAPAPSAHCLDRGTHGPHAVRFEADGRSFVESCEGADTARPAPRPVLVNVDTTGRAPSYVEAVQLSRSDAWAVVRFADDEDSKMVHPSRVRRGGFTPCPRRGMHDAHAWNEAVGTGAVARQCGGRA